MNDFQIMEECEEVNKSKPKSDLFQCKVCPYNTLRKPYLDKHMQQKHGFSQVKSMNKRTCRTNTRTNVKKKRKSTKSENNEDDFEFGCEMCDFRTNHDGLLTMHLETHETEDGEMYQCTQCDFQTIEVNALGTHESTHKKLELYSCPNCDYASRHKCNFKVHMKTHEDPASLEEYSCKFCVDFNSYHKSSLYKHISLKHKGSSQIFQCEKCAYATPRKAHLLSHQNTHTESAELPAYRCEICDFQTHNEGTIRRHVKKHREREEKGEELIVKEIDGVMQVVWFCCHLCEFRSKDQRYVMLHKKVHARADEINRLGQLIIHGQRKGVKTNLEDDCVDIVEEENS